MRSAFILLVTSQIFDLSMAEVPCAEVHKFLDSVNFGLHLFHLSKCNNQKILRRRAWFKQFLELAILLDTLESTQRTNMERPFQIALVDSKSRR